MIEKTLLILAGAFCLFHAAHVEATPSLFCYFTRDSDGTLSDVPKCVNKLPSGSTFKIMNNATETYLSYTSKDKRPKLRTMPTSGVGFTWKLKLTITEPSDTFLYITQTGSKKLNLEHPGNLFPEDDIKNPVWAVLSDKTATKLRKFNLFCFNPDVYGDDGTGACTLTMKGFCPNCMEDFLLLGLPVNYTKNSNGDYTANYGAYPNFGPVSEANGNTPEQYWKFVLSS